MAKEINRLVQENTENLERQIDLTMKFDKVQLAVKSTVQILQTEFENLSQILQKHLLLDKQRFEI